MEGRRSSRGRRHDLFGNGKTALKMAIGRYVGKNGIGITQNNNPIQTSINSVSRTWNDLLHQEGDPRRGNFVPDCDLASRALNGECGARIRTSAVSAPPRATPTMRCSVRARSYNWDFTTEVQHELSPRVSMTAGYYRNWFGNHLVTDNILVTPADFDPFCITAPSDSRLPGGGGYQVCGPDDVTPALVWSGHSVTQGDHYGELKRVNDFFNVTVTARLKADLILGGGVDTGRSVNDACFEVDSPGAIATALPGNIVGGGAGISPRRRRSPARRSTDRASAGS